MSSLPPDVPNDSASRPLLTKRAPSLPSYQSTSGSPGDSEASTEPEAKLTESHPEGGLTAWLSAFGSFCGMICSSGLINSIGTFQSYLIRNQLSTYSAADVGWIFGLYLFISYFCGIVAGPMFDARGPRILMLVGSLCLLASIFFLGLCTRYYHFILVFSVLGGVGTSLIASTSLSSIGHFFNRRRGLVTGIAFCGGSLGGIAFPIFLPALFTSSGFGAATRALGFFFIPLLLIANVLVGSRLSPKPFSRATLLPDLAIFNDLIFVVVIIALLLVEWGLFIPLGYITSFALSNGIDRKISNQLLSILNAGSFFGRLLPGFLADRIGRFNTMILMIIMCFITTIALWMPAAIASEILAKKWLSIFFALGFGFSSGGVISLGPPVIGELCETKDYGRYFSTCFTIVGIGTLMGIPVGGEILKRDHGSYEGMIGFSGACYAAGLGLFVYARIMRVGWSCGRQGVC